MAYENRIEAESRGEEGQHADGQVVLGLRWAGIEQSV